MHSLLDRILSGDNLRNAYTNVVGNRGSSGVDGVNVEELRAHLQIHWPRIEAEIRAGDYQPSPVLGVEIPKSVNSTEKCTTDSCQKCTRTNLV